MRPTKAVPDPPSANLPLRQHPAIVLAIVVAFVRPGGVICAPTEPIIANVKQTIRAFVRRRAVYVVLFFHWPVTEMADLGTLTSY